jgi:acetyl-CoA acetyltransferase
VVNALRTPIGKYGGALKSVRPDDLAAIVLHAIIEKTGIEAGKIDEVILGCANQAGEDNRNVARILTTLVHEMKRKKTEYGLATMCIGVGQGISTIVRLTSL